MADNPELTDKDIAIELIINSKTTVNTLAKALTETTNPQLRDVLKTQLTANINSHFRLSDIAAAKGWNDAFLDPQQQLQMNINEIQTLSK